MQKQNLAKNTAIKFVVLIGIVSLFSDMTYEGARSITGPYLAVLGANAAIVGFVAGFGELVGYSLRLISGYLADKTGKYWIITIIGYICNLVAVPLLALAHHWWIAALLMTMERTGKAIRTPARDAMLSYAGNRMGMGWGFGLHEALDQTGAMLGPLLVAAVLYYKNSYHESFAVLGIPAILALMILAFARWLYPRPQDLEIKQYDLETHNTTLPFWLYLTGGGLIAAGYADFPLMAYHFEKTSLVPPTWIPLTYAFALGVNMIVSPLMGYLYDRKGFIVLLIISLFACLFSPLVFLGNFKVALIGIIIWGVGVGAQGSLMRAIIANMVPIKKRGSAYGIFNTGYGICWFLGSVLMGILYDISVPLLVIFSVIIQLAALPFLWKVMRMTKNHHLVNSSSTHSHKI